MRIFASDRVTSMIEDEGGSTLGMEAWQVEYMGPGVVR